MLRPRIVIPPKAKFSVGILETIKCNKHSHGVLMRKTHFCPESSMSFRLNKYKHNTKHEEKIRCYQLQ